MMFTTGALLIILSRVLSLYIDDKYAYKVRPKPLALLWIALFSLGSGLMMASVLVMAWKVMP